MAVINHAKREINAKIVYFGPPGCGKGEMFQFIHQESSQASADHSSRCLPVRIHCFSLTIFRLRPPVWMAIYPFFHL